MGFFQGVHSPPKPSWLARAGKKAASLYFGGNQMRTLVLAAALAVGVAGVAGAAEVKKDTKKAPVVASKAMTDTDMDKVTAAGVPDSTRSRPRYGPEPPWEAARLQRCQICCRGRHPSLCCQEAVQARGSSNEKPQLMGRPSGRPFTLLPVRSRNSEPICLELYLSHRPLMKPRRRRVSVGL